jgi:hypothetical protein
MINECRAVGGMRIGRGNRSSRRKFAAVPLCPPENPYDLKRDRTRAAVVKTRRLTTRVMAWRDCQESDDFVRQYMFRPCKQALNGRRFKNKKNITNLMT